MNRNLNEIYITDEESKICKLDNKIFPSSRKMLIHVKNAYGLNFEEYILKAYYENKRPVCLKTGTPLAFKASKLGPFFSNYSKNNFIRKPHSKETKEKIKRGCETTSIKKYGVKNVFSTDWCKDKIKNTLTEKYGVDNIMKLDEMKNYFRKFEKNELSIEQSKITSIEKFGEEHYSKTSKHRLNIRKKGFYRLYKTWENYIKLLIENSNNKIICLGSEHDIEMDSCLKFSCNICGHIWNESYLLNPQCPTCLNIFKNSRSVEEEEFKYWLKSIPNTPIFLSNKRFNTNGKIYEADICIESRKIIIEFNGLFWHSEFGGKKDRMYHLNKLNFFENLGYRVIQIFEDEWLFKQSIVKNKILHILNLNTSLEKIYARKCKISRIDSKIGDEFLNKTHIQGSTISKYYYGCFYEEKLVSVMTFSSLRNNMGNNKNNIINGEYEITRFSSDPEYIVIGAAGKMLATFIKEFTPIKIISYADKRWTSPENNLYKKLNMVHIKDTSPNYWYVKKYKREYRYKYRKSELSKRLNLFNNDLSEWENMKNNGWDRIWDCGNFKYSLDVLKP